LAATLSQLIDIFLELVSLMLLVLLFFMMVFISFIELFIPDLFLGFVVRLKVKRLLCFKHLSSRFNTFISPLDIFLDDLHLCIELGLTFMKGMIFSFLFIRLKRQP
jgi:hypothetical protein